MKKGYLLVLLTLLISISLVACGNNDMDTENQTEKAQQVEEEQAKEKEEEQKKEKEAIEEENKKKAEEKSKIKKEQKDISEEKQIEEELIEEKEEPVEEANMESLRKLYNNVNNEYDRQKNDFNSTTWAEFGGGFKSEIDKLNTLDKNQQNMDYNLLLGYIKQLHL